MKKLVLWFVLVFSATVIWGQSVPEIQKLMAEENYSAARKMARELAKKTPTDGDAYFYIGETFYYDEQPDSASFYYNRGNAVNGESAAPHVGIGKLLLDKGQVSEAEKSFGRALRFSKKKPAEAYSLIGSAYLTNQKPNSDKALANFTLARDNDTKNPRYFVLLGDAQMAADKVGEALTNYEFAAGKDKENPEVQMKIARTYLKNGIKDVGQQRLEEVISRFPNYPPAYKDLYELYFQGQMYSKGTPLLSKYVSLVGDDVDARARLARFLVGFAKDYDNGLKEAQTVLQQDPNRVEMYRWLARCQVEKGQAQEGFNSAKTFLEKVGTGRVFSSDYEYLAKAAAKTNQFDIATANYRKVFEMDSTRKEAMLKEIARMNWGATPKRYQEAADAYNELVALGKASSQDMFFLGQCYMQLKNFALADSTFKKYIEINPTAYQGWASRARVNKQLEPDKSKPAQAKPYYEKLISMLETELEATKADANKKRTLIESYNYLAEHNANTLNDYNAAIAFFDKVLAVDPANAEATKNKEMVQAALGGTTPGKQK